MQLKEAQLAKVYELNRLGIIPDSLADAKGEKLLDQVLTYVKPPSLTKPPWLPPLSRPLPSVRDHEKFDLELSRDQQGQLQVRVLSSPQGEARETCPLPDYHSDKVEPGGLRHGRPPAAGAPSTEPSVATDAYDLGQDIGAALLPDKVGICFWKSLSSVSTAEEGSRGLRIYLRIQEEEVANIPWEVARVGEDFLSLRLRTPIVRYVEAEEEPGTLTVEGPLRVLGIVSHRPPEIEAAKERALLDDAMARLTASQRVHWQWLPTADSHALQTALYSCPHVVHYIGHGSYDKSAEPPQGVLHFETGDMGAEWLATLLRDSDVRFVFLNACETGRAAGGMAEVLVRRGVPAALGMQTAVRDDVAIAFARGFYEALSALWPVDMAVVQGRKAIVNALKNDPSRPYWAEPVLYMRASDGRLFEHSEDKGQ